MCPLTDGIPHQPRDVPIVVDWRPHGGAAPTVRQRGLPVGEKRVDIALEGGSREIEPADIGDAVKVVLDLPRYLPRRSHNCQVARQTAPISSTLAHPEENVLRWLT